MVFLTKSKHLITLKIKDKKLFGRNCILNNLIKSENLNYRGLFVAKGSGSGYGIFPDPDPGDPNRPDPDPQHWLKRPSLVYMYTQGLPLIEIDGRRICCMGSQLKNNDKDYFFYNFLLITN